MSLYLHKQQIKIFSIILLSLTMVFLQHIEQGMLPISRCYNPKVYSTTMGRRNFFTSSTSTTSNNLFSRGISATKPKLKTESKEVAAKKHSDAERRRRVRINNQFATLRTILPNLVKDKASLLGETVRYYNELKHMVKDIPTAPSLEDILRLGHYNNKKNLAKVVFSCSDREGLMSEVAMSIKGAKAKAVRAGIMTVGGRTKCALFFQDVNGNEGLIQLKKSLKAVVNGKTSSDTKYNNNGGSLLP